jgi:hypothetical protein
VVIDEDMQKAFTYLLYLSSCIKVLISSMYLRPYRDDAGPRNAIRKGQRSKQLRTRKDKRFQTAHQDRSVVHMVMCQVAR